MPDSGTPRRTRLRLTRHRPGPSRVRARQRADDSEASSRLGGLNLLTLGAIVTIVASLGGLVATGVGTIWSARVSADQLVQSREQQEDKQREQAARVSAWVDRSNKEVSRLHLSNRSPDPVNGVKVRFLATDSQVGSFVVIWFNIQLDSLPPCSDTVIKQEDLRFFKVHHYFDYGWLTVPVDWKDKAGAHKFKKAHFFDPDVTFADRDGVKWSRLRGNLSRSADVHPKYVAPWVAEAIKPPSVQPISDCGDNSGK
ncbi:hypothetical protein ABT075_46265 [Streptomyces sp. NPDC002677]|uniref:hypothetical protein n=1 Tax=Streptomyces sp. NPDC002677 TaxID=3154774 RepID=UPI00332B0BFF